MFHFSLVYYVRERKTHKASQPHQKPPLQTIIDTIGYKNARDVKSRKT